MAGGLELRSVQKGKGKVHLTAAVPSDAPVHTLCGQVLPPGTAREVDLPANCSICERRRRNPALVSSAFFMGDMGAEVLQLSLQQAQERQRAVPKPARPEPEVRPAARVKPERPPAGRQSPSNKPAAGPAPTPARRIGELDTAGLREFSDNVYLAPDGVIVRIDEGRIAEVVGEGRYQLSRRGSQLILRAGAFVVEAEVTEVQGHGGEG